jgi:hypothetical protein
MADAQQVYDDLRNLALHATGVRTSGGAIAGVVVDIRAEGGFASIASFGDGTTSRYTSTGGGTIGAGSYGPVAQATRNLLSAAASNAASFVHVDTGDWPPSRSVRFHLVSSHGNRFVDVPEASFWGRKKHNLMPLIQAAQAVVTGIRQVQEAQSASLPGRATPLMAAAHQGDAGAVEGLLQYGARLEVGTTTGIPPSCTPPTPAAMMWCECSWNTEPT